MARHLALAAALVIGCGASEHKGHDKPHQHGHDHSGHYAHRFDDADKWAARFDDPSRDAWQKPADVIALLEIAPGMTAVDIGAGTGYFLPHLSAAVGADGAVVGLDVEPDMVRYMTERIARDKLINASARAVGGADPELEAGSVDRVLIVNTWHHIPERRAYSARLREALEPGGFVAVVDYTKDSPRGPPAKHRIPPEVVVAELGAAGLRAEIASESLPYQYVVIGRR